VVTGSLLRLVPILGGDSPARGWQLTMAVYGLVAVGLFAVAFSTTRERVAPPPSQHTRLGEDVGDLARNRPWLALLGMGLFVILAIALRNGTAAYYLKYYVKRPELTQSFLSVGMVAYMAGAACTPLITRLVAKRTAYLALMLAFAGLSALFFVIPPDQIGALFVVHALASLVLGPKSPLMWSMYADAADYPEWRNGRRATGLVFAAATFSVKAGGALAGAVAGWLLAALGYVANQPQSASAERGILVLVSLLPAGCALVAAAMVRFYRLDARALAAIRTRLDRRRATRAMPAETPDRPPLGAASPGLLREAP